MATKIITHADISSEHMASGGILCAAMVNGYRVSERYYGYSMREARQAFYRDVNAGVIR